MSIYLKTGKSKTKKRVNIWEGMERMQPVDIQGRAKGRATIAVASSERPAATEQSQGMRPETGDRREGTGAVLHEAKGQQ